MDYIIMTPVRNEQQHLPVAAKSLLSQDLPPRLWLIVNDGSTDQTEKIIQELGAHSWIVSRSLPPEPAYLGEHFAKIVRYGFTELQAEAETRGIDYELIGKIDADVSFDASCFSSLVREFEKDESLGIASPRLGFSSDQSHMSDSLREWKPDLALSDHPTDGVRLYRRQCFEEIGGIQIARAPDTVAEVKATIKGWKARRFDHIHASTSRKSHHSTSLWSRLVILGSAAWYLGYNPFLVLARACFEVLFGRPRYRSLAYVYGYLKSALQRVPRIKDKEVLDHFGHRRLRNVVVQAPALFWRGITQQVKVSHEE